MVDIVKTRAELVTEAARQLGIIGVGQDLSTEDETLIDDKIDTLFLQLEADGIWDTPGDNQIPSEYFDALGMLLANNCAPHFGQPFNPQMKIVAEAFVRRTAAARPTGETLKTLYY